MVNQDSLRDYVIILNPSKCGSTWLAEALSIRPYLLAPGELDFIFFLEFPMEKQWNSSTAGDPEYLRVREDPTMSPPEKLRELYRLARNRHSGVRMLIDKSPSNVLVFPRYYHVFREAHLVILHRDLRDVYVSLELYQQNVLKNRPPYQEIGDPDYLLDRSCLWYAVKNVRATLESERLLQRAGIPFLRITYEEMIADFNDVVWRVLAFSGLDLDPSVPVIPWDARKPLPLGNHLESAVRHRPLFRKGIVGDWKNHIVSDAARDVVKEMAGDLLIELGYESDYTW